MSRVAATDKADESEPTETRQSRGIINVGGDFRISDWTLSFADDGTATTVNEPTLALRTHMWPFWLEEAIDAATMAADVSSRIPPLVAQVEEALKGGEPVEAADDAIYRLVSLELRATMRAITSCAFAVDAFYAMVKAHSPAHPQQAAWTKKRTARHIQVAETFRYHLKIGKASAAKELRSRIAQLYKFRDWAVHPGVRFREPEYRADLNASLDWHFVAFRAENAVTVTAMTMYTIDLLVTGLHRGSEELAGYQEYAGTRIDEIFLLYDAAKSLPIFPRAEPPANAD
jgi:hypothetical protein